MVTTQNVASVSFGLYLGLSRGCFSGNWFRRCVCGIAHRCFVSMRRTTEIAPSSCDMVDLSTRSHFVFANIWIHLMHLVFRYHIEKFLTICYNMFSAYSMTPFRFHLILIAQWWSEKFTMQEKNCCAIINGSIFFQPIGSQFTMYGLAELVLCHAMAHQAPGYHQIHSTWRGGLRARDCWKDTTRPSDDQYQLYITFMRFPIPGIPWNRPSHYSPWLSIETHGDLQIPHDLRDPHIQQYIGTFAQ